MCAYCEEGEEIEEIIDETIFSQYSYNISININFLYFAFSYMKYKSWHIVQQLNIERSERENI